MSHNPCLQYLFATVRARDLSYFLRSPKHSLQLPTQTLLFSKKKWFLIYELIVMLWQPLKEEVKKKEFATQDIDMGFDKLH